MPAQNDARYPADIAAGGTLRPRPFQPAEQAWAHPHSNLDLSAELDHAVGSGMRKNSVAGSALRCNVLYGRT